MANSKIKTLWTISGRVLDSREVLDSNGGMLGGRIDIPASQAVKADGYDFIEYRTTLSDGSVMTHTDFQQWIGSLKGVVESKSGSGVMTVYVPAESAPSDFGMFQLDVYKEWSDSSVDPEPETGDPIEGTIRNWAINRTGERIFTWEKYNSSQGYWSNFGHWHDSWSDALVNSFNQMSTDKLGNLKDALGITGGGGGTRPVPLVADAKYVDLAPMPETPSSVADEAVVIAWMKAVTDMLTKTKANDKEAQRTINEVIAGMKGVGLMQTTK